jgi:pyruvate dehydrogenase E2 component (dihydrolipoamide acetyltransferase)
MTDKATVMITSPKAGKILETRGEVGKVVPVHAVLVVFDLEGGTASSERAAPAAASAREPAAASSSGGAPVSAGGEGPAATAVGDIRDDLPGMNLAQRAPARPSNGGATNGGGYYNAKPLATPATRKLARDLGVDLRRVPPTGPKGRVTKDDVRLIGVDPNSAADALAPSAAAEPTVASQRTPSLAVSPVSITPSGSARADAPAPEERIAVRGLRKRIFEGMARSKHTAAHYTFVEECDVTALKALRERLRGSAESAGVKLTYLPFFVKAAIAALKKHPTLNSAYDETTNEIVVRRYFNIGIAVATEAGLIVPVVRDADRKSLLDVGREIARLGDAAREGKTRPQDVGGSTFTITSLGQQGGLFATPILNFPEVAILGVHQMKQKPVVRDGRIVIGDVMLLSLSFDHRIIDGHVGAAFAYELISYLEDPDRLFLEMA